MRPAASADGPFVEALCRSILCLDVRISAKKEYNAMATMNPDAQFIESIKLVRRWGLETFGVMPSLKMSKDFIAELRQEQRQMSHEEIENVIKMFGKQMVEDVLRFSPEKRY
jgi:hypothetical protein